jgi:hypothetical protein
MTECMPVLAVCLFGRVSMPLAFPNNHGSAKCVLLLLNAAAPASAGCVPGWLSMGHSQPGPAWAAAPHRCATHLNVHGMYKALLTQ